MHLGKGAVRVRLHLGLRSVLSSRIMVRLSFGLGYNNYEDQGICGQGGIRGRL